MIITGYQIKEARELLGWSSRRLAGRAKTSLAVAVRAEMSDGQPLVEPDKSTAIQAVLEAAGIEFTSSPAPGVRLKEVAPITADQIKAARKALGWSMATLAQRSGRSVLMISKAEQSALPEPFRIRCLAAVRQTFESVGVEFIPEDGGGAGIKIR